MAYRNGTYVTFHIEGSPSPAESDMNYRLPQVLKNNENKEFWFVNSHEKAAAVRDSTKLKLMNWIAERLRSSKNMLIVITESTRKDKHWVPFEIEYAIDICGIPIIAAYPDYEWILKPQKKERLWPDALCERIAAQTARVIHIPFKPEPIKHAILQFDLENRPIGALSYYPEEVYKSWGMIL